MEKAPAGSQWRLNVGRALDVLRRDVAGLFSRRNYTPDFSIYSPEIEVRTVVTVNVTLHGRSERPGLVNVVTKNSMVKDPPCWMGKSSN